MSLVETGICPDIEQLIDRLKANLALAIKGKDTEIETLISAVLAGESVLVEDVPGVGKTSLAKAVASSLDLDFQRVQCTPDLLPADVFGVAIFNPQDCEFHFRKGPVFTNLLLVDEINRASPRTQSALLEAMAERQITVEGKAWTLEPPFVVIATQNPTGAHGTFPLPASQLDRFAIRMSLDYPDRDSELEILYRDNSIRFEERVDAVLTKADYMLIQQKISEVNFEKSLGNYMLEIVDRTRNHQDIELGCSPRGAISFFNTVKSLALVSGRNFVLPDDIQRLAPLALAHRIVLGGRFPRDETSESIRMINELVGSIDVPV